MNGRETKCPHCYIISFGNDGLITEISCYWDYDTIYAQLGHTKTHQ